MVDVIQGLISVFRTLMGGNQPMDERELDTIVADSAINKIDADPLVRQLEKLDVGYPFKNWEIGMLDENINPLQRKVALSIMQPPQVSGVGSLFQESLSARYLRNRQRESIGQFTFIFSFMLRVTNLLQAAREAIGAGLFYLPPGLLIGGTIPEAALEGAPYSFVVDDSGQVTAEAENK